MTASATPTLLCNADFYGTLAATRWLGRAGVPVYVADPQTLAPALWSRHTTRALTCPDISDAPRFTDWLLEFGHREPGTVLVGTSDETAFLYALHMDELSSSFKTYQPGLDVILKVLDKEQLYAAAKEVGLGVPATWYPETQADVERLSREVPLPLLIKPRTQILSNTHSKGFIVRDRCDLVARWRAFVRSNAFPSLVADRMPKARLPMLQEYVPDAADRIFVLAAFIDRKGELFAARGGVKVFQRPRRLGIGLCFESAVIEPRVIEAARRLAKKCGYFGLFQLEFIQDGEQLKLIDFNPRLYNQAAFDMARGLPVAELMHAGATGDDVRMARAVARANESAGAKLVFCNDFGLEMVLAAQRLSGRMSGLEVARWRGWRAANRDRAVSPAVAKGDLVPAIVDVVNQLYACVRYPRSFIRSIVLNG